MQLWFVLALVGGVQGPTVATQSPALEEAVAVQALADELKSPATPGVRLIYDKLTAETKGAAAFDQWVAALFPSRAHTRVSDELLLNYWSVNRKPRALTHLTDIAGIPVRYVTRVGEENLPATGGVLAVSRVGLTARGDSALVTVSIYCRGLCGSQKLCLYVLKDGQWKQQEILRWLVSQEIARPSAIRQARGPR
jgi:hypothetical protein